MTHHRPASKRIITTYLRQGLLSLLLTCVSAAHAEEWIYTVVPGDTLSEFSAKYLTRVSYWHGLQQINKIADPYNIPPGTRLRVPVAWLKQQPASALLRQAQGEVRRVAADGSVEDLRSGIELHTGDRLTTGSNSNATLEFADGSQLLMQADSEILLDTLSAYGDTGMVDTRVRLPRGRVDTRVVPRKGGASRYEIITPAAVAAVRGTDFRVGADAEGIAHNEVLHGKVGVSGAGVARAVGAGFGTTAQAGHAPLAPRPLLPAPDTATTAALVERIPLSFSWPKVQDATAYRAQVFAQRAFDTLLLDTLSDIPTVHWSDLPDGDYTLRVRGIDKVGLEGLNADHDFTLNARPEPPALLSALDGSVLYEQQPLFQWAAVTGIVDYHFQLAHDAQFTQLEVDLPQFKNTQSKPAQALALGKHYWRIAARDGAGDTGPFSDAQSIEIKPTPPAPELEKPAIDDDQLTLSWRAGAADARYHLQLARDEQFTQLIAEQGTDKAKVTLPRPSSGSYYLRVRSIAPDGYEGPYGAAQRISVPPKSYWPLLILLLPALL